MIIKKTIRFASYALAFLGIAATGSSCGDDEGDLCYKCSYGGDSETLCFKDYKENYNDEATKDDFKEFIAYIEDYGVDCDKK